MQPVKPGAYQLERNSAMYSALTRFALTLVITGLTASPALATNAITVVNEATGTACSNLGAGHLSGGCPGHAEGLIEQRIDLGIFGEVHEAQCDVELDGRAGGNGEFAVDDMEVYNNSPGTDANCVGASPVVTECDLPWEGRGEKDTAGHTIARTIAICINPAESSSDCVGNLNYNVVETEATESLTVVFNNASVGLCEVDTDLVAEVDGGDTPVHVN